MYLHALDCQMKQKGYRMVRYADDFVVLCRSAEQAQAALAEVKAWVGVNGLSLNAGRRPTWETVSNGGRVLNFWVITSKWGDAG